MAKEPKTLNEKEPTLDVKKGDRVRLLVPIYDNVQWIAADTEINWPFDDPPLKTTAALAGEKTTPLDAPAMTAGKPPADYVDPATGEKPIIESV